MVINKVDRPGARPDWVVDQTFDLFDKLGATDEQLDFPIIYASGLNGFAKLELEEVSDNMRPLFDTVLKHVPTRRAAPTRRCSCRFPRWTTPPILAAWAWVAC